MANHAWSYVADYILVTILVFVSSIFFHSSFFRENLFRKSDTASKVSKYGVFLVRIQSEYRKIRARKHSVFDLNFAQG